MTFLDRSCNERRDHSKSLCDFAFKAIKRLFFLDLETDVVPIISYHVGHIYNQFMFSTYITQINWELFNELAGTKIVFGVPMRHSTL